MKPAKSSWLSIGREHGLCPARQPLFGAETSDAGVNATTMTTTTAFSSSEASLGLEKPRDAGEEPLGDAAAPCARLLGQGPTAPRVAGLRDRGSRGSRAGFGESKLNVFDGFRSFSIISDHFRTRQWASEISSGARLLPRKLQTLQDSNFRLSESV